MLQLGPIEKDFVPYSRRPVRKNNVGLFVKGGRRRAPRPVALQASAPYQPPYQPYRCKGKNPCDPCDTDMICNAGLVCVSRGDSTVQGCPNAAAG